MLFSRSRVPRKHLTCVIGGFRVSVLFGDLFGDSGNDRLGSGGGGGGDRGLGSGGRGRGGASDCHGFLGRVTILAILAAADNAG